MIQKRRTQERYFSCSLQIIDSNISQKSKFYNQKHGRCWKRLFWGGVAAIIAPLNCVRSRDVSRIKIFFLVVKRCSLSIFPTLLNPVLFGILLFQHVVPLSFLRSDYKPPLLICHKHIFTFVHYNGDPCAIRVRIILNKRLLSLRTSRSRS